MILLPSIFGGVLGLSVITFLSLSLFVLPGAFADSSQNWQIEIMPGSSNQDSTLIFNPAELPVFLDDTVEWINHDNVAHDITSGLPNHPDYQGYFFEAGTVKPRESVSVKIESREYEAFYYLCKIHPWMTGKLFLSEAVIAQPETDSPIVTEKETYLKGEEISVSGQVHEDFWGTDFEILVYDQANNLIDVKYGEFNEDSSYSETFQTTSKSWQNDGKYQLKLVYGLPSKVAQTQIQFDSKQLGNEIPVWIKDIGKFWCNNEINDSEFVNAIEFLIQNDIIKTNQLDTTVHAVQTMPDWIKDTTCWWSENQISDIDYLSGIEFLINKGLIKV